MIKPVSGFMRPGKRQTTLIKNCACCTQNPYNRFAGRYLNAFFAVLKSNLTLKAPRKSASENVVCLCRLLHLLANFSNLHFTYCLKEQSDLGPHCLQQ